MAIVEDNLGIQVATRSAQNRVGRPRSAEPCRCPEPAVDDETCIWCGHIPAADLETELARLREAQVRQGRRARRGYLSSPRLGRC